MSLAAPRTRQQEDEGYVLHTYPYRETSLVVELFTRVHGRVGVIAKGAKRPGSQLRGVLLSFQPLSVAWAGKTELRTLARAEWQRVLPQLSGVGLLCGFYVSELVLKLTRRDDPHETLYDQYARAMEGLREAQPAQFGPLLRRFELRLLRELGYAAAFDRDALTGAPIVAEASYEYRVETGPVAVAPDPRRVQFSGRTVLDVASDNFGNPTTRQEARELMRLIINHYLDGEPLRTRQLLVDLQSL